MTRRLLLGLMLLLGCGSPEASVELAPDAEAPALTPDAGALGMDTGASPVVGKDAGGTVDQRPAPGPDATSSAPDTRKTYAACASTVRLTQGCGHLDGDSRPVRVFKDGWSCAICFQHANDRPDYSMQVTGCVVPVGAGAQPGFENVLCVSVCGECR